MRPSCRACRGQWAAPDRKGADRTSRAGWQSGRQSKKVLVIQQPIRARFRWREPNREEAGSGRQCRWQRSRTEKHRRRVIHVPRLLVEARFNETVRARHTARFSVDTEQQADGLAGRAGNRIVAQRVNVVVGQQSAGIERNCQMGCDATSQNGTVNFYGARSPSDGDGARPGGGMRIPNGSPRRNRTEETALQTGTGSGVVRGAVGLSSRLKVSCASAGTNANPIMATSEPTSTLQESFIRIPPLRIWTRVG